MRYHGGVNCWSYDPGAVPLGTTLISGGEMDLMTRAGYLVGGPAPIPSSTNTQKQVMNGLTRIPSVMGIIS
jgi:hypothetical protein